MPDGFTSFRREPEMWDVEFDFDTNAGSNPASVNGRGVASVVRTGVGTYLATLRETYVKLKGCSPELLAPSGDGRWAGMGPTDVAVAKTVTIYTYNAGGALTDFAANANSRVYVGLAMSATVQKP